MIDLYLQFHTRKLITSILLLLSIPASVYAQVNEVPRTYNGLPDFTGVWNFTDDTPFERSPEFGEREFLTDDEIAARIENRRQRDLNIAETEANASQQLLDGQQVQGPPFNVFWAELSESDTNPRTSQIVFPANGRLPELTNPSLNQPSAMGANPCSNGLSSPARPVRISFGAISCDRPEDFALASRCLYWPQTGGPHTIGNNYNNNLRIVQTEDHIVITAEMGNAPRIIPIDGRPFAENRAASWTGDSRGHFEGDTLVVETRNVSDKVASVFFRGVAYGDASQRVLTERFALNNSGELDYEYSIDDPATFSDQVIARTKMTKTDGEIYEYACHEGNYALTNMLQAARLEDAAER